MNKPTIQISREIFSNEKFPPHGKFSASLDGQLIHMEATGPFNFELLSAYYEATLPMYVEAHSHGAYAVLVEFHRSMLMNCEAVQLLAESVARLVRNDNVMIAVAYVSGLEVEGQSVMVPYIQKNVFEANGIVFKVFNAVADAEIWLHQLLADGVK
ncbi:hypothetical protein [Solimicrobium silvestre]|uniref:SpoIIAA-like n=1 Tax=Solimicrobium silvestre TaxID=2099400 RepID=A0A2S9GXY1_9BURK|nr:hypothetical protein [Solimicrobium silvestre]PRC92573.1 hypothetical protein S2091_2628 [Solimicrobium silvestre]